MNSSSKMRVRWAAIGAAVAVTVGGGALGVVNATVTSGARAVFIPITPCRLFDTRPDSQIGLRGAPIAARRALSDMVFP